ncbi:MAG TPA: hypothetical protein PLJ29_05845 [Leptospiraceae bacterium]|nr:hypothetical protein [Leptospiraceae bacterium]HNI25861.1 hypothetical protein [Leptospiraceae bacterium]
MKQFDMGNPEIEMIGSAALSVVNGIKTSFSQKIIQGILKDNGLENVEAEKWYQTQKWLNAFRTISEQIGANTVFLTGMAIPENALLPPEISTIEAALSAINIAYHMNHRLNGEPLFDPSSGRINDIIGNYKCNILGDRKVQMICDNPYPCDFDRGLIEGFARKFKSPGSSGVSAVHSSRECRKNGDYFCEYTVTW